MQWQAPRARPRPPLTKRLRPGHWLALDVAVAAVLTLSLTLPIQHGIFQNGGLQAPGDLLVAFVLAVLLCVPVALRRRRPLAAFAAAVAAGALVALLVPSANAPYFLPAVFVLYLVAAVSRRRVALAALGALLVLAVVQDLRAEPLVRVPGHVLPAILIAVVAWTFGYMAGQRRAYAEHLQDQAATSAVTEERLRIARELHDVVAHSMTVIAVQAGYGRHVIDAQPAKAGEALGAIQATSREALTDMRRMLGILRRPGAEPFGPHHESGRASGADPGAMTALGAVPGTNGQRPADGSAGGAAGGGPANGFGREPAR